jgi:hypothetical protein
MRYFLLVPVTGIIQEAIIDFDFDLDRVSVDVDYTTKRYSYEFIKFIKGSQSNLFIKVKRFHSFEEEVDLFALAVRDSLKEIKEKYEGMINK